MVKQEEINANFIEVIQFMKREYGYTQEFIVKKAKLGKSSISKITNGSNVGDKTINKLCEAFSQLNPDFFYGRSPYKTLREQSEAKMEEALKDTNRLIERFDNPNPSPSLPDYSTVINAALASKDGEIENLKIRVKEITADKNTIIKKLEDIIAEKNARIAELKDRLVEYRKIIDAKNGLADYPFHIGTAEADRKQKHI